MGRHGGRNLKVPDPAAAGLGQPRGATAAVCSCLGQDFPIFNKFLECLIVLKFVLRVPLGQARAATAAVRSDS